MTKINMADRDIARLRGVAPALVAQERAQREAEAHGPFDAVAFEPGSGVVEAPAFAWPSDEDVAQMEAWVGDRKIEPDHLIRFAVRLSPPKLPTSEAVHQAATAALEHLKSPTVAQAKAAIEQALGELLIGPIDVLLPDNPPARRPDECLAYPSLAPHAPDPERLTTLAAVHALAEQLWREHNPAGRVVVDSATHEGERWTLVRCSLGAWSQDVLVEVAPTRGQVDLAVGRCWREVSDRVARGWRP
jgi:hypothetical protein